MKELRHDDGVFDIDDQVAEALEHLAVVLAKSRMSAKVRLHPPGMSMEVEFTLGMDRTKGTTNPLKARPSSADDTSRLGLEEI